MDKKEAFLKSLNGYHPDASNHIKHEEKKLSKSSAAKDKKREFAKKINPEKGFAKYEPYQAKND